MKLKSQQDVAAGIETAFADIGDFTRLERQALRRRIEVVRTGRSDDPAQAAWRLDFMLRGKPRTVNANVVRYDPPNGYVLLGTTDGLKIDVTVDLIALSKTRTRVMVSIVLTPTTIGAKLLVQSMRLAKSNIDRRFDGALADFCARIGDRGSA